MHTAAATVQLTWGADFRTPALSSLSQAHQHHHHSKTPCPHLSCSNADPIRQHNDVNCQQCTSNRVTALNTKSKFSAAMFHCGFSEIIEIFLVETGYG